MLSLDLRCPFWITEFCPRHVCHKEHRREEDVEPRRSLARPVLPPKGKVSYRCDQAQGHPIVVNRAVTSIAVAPCENESTSANNIPGATVASALGNYFITQFYHDRGVRCSIPSGQLHHRPLRPSEAMLFGCAQGKLLLLPEAHAEVCHRSTLPPQS